MLILLIMAALQVTPAAAGDSRLYIVGPNDVLAVSVFNQPQLSGKFAIEADGTLAFPLLGRVAAGGLSVRAVEDKLKQGLSAGFLADPQVSVTVDQYRSQQIFVMGEVRQPGSLQFTGSMTLIEALARAGSTTERAGMEAVIVRAPAAGAAGSSGTSDAPSGDTIRVNLQNLQNGVLTQNVALRAGDTVSVPRADTVFVTGQVKTPGEYVIRRLTTVRQALALAGGVTDRGSTRRIKIMRIVEGKEVEMSVDLRATVQPGDTIVVYDRFF